MQPTKTTINTQEIISQIKLITELEQNRQELYKQNLEIFDKMIELVKTMKENKMKGVKND